jgi:hypothetical protein
LAFDFFMRKNVAGVGFSGCLTDFNEVSFLNS